MSFSVLDPFDVSTNATELVGPLNNLMKTDDDQVQRRKTSINLTVCSVMVEQEVELEVVLLVSMLVQWPTRFQKDLRL